MAVPQLPLSDASGKNNLAAWRLWCNGSAHELVELVDRVRIPVAAPQERLPRGGVFVILSTYGIPRYRKRTR